MPPKRRLMPASLAAASKPEKLRTTPGVPSEVVEKGMASLPKNDANTVAAPRLKVLCPDVYSGNGGVGISELQVTSGSVSGLPSVSASRMAEIGRHRSYVNFASQQEIAASAMVRLSNANRRAFSSKVSPSAALTVW